MWLAVGRTLAIAAWFLVAVARAEPPRARLTWSRPPDSLCPTSATLEQDVEELSGRPVFSHDAREAQIWVHGQVEEQASFVRASLEARSARGVLLGRRELSAKAGGCASLRRPLALVLTMLLEAPLPKDDPPERWRRASSTQLLLGASIAALSGALPRTTPGAGLALALAVSRRLELTLDALYWLPVSVETRAGSGARFHALTGMLGVCPRLFGAAGAPGLAACGAGQLGGLWASPRALEGSARSTRLIAQASLMLKATLPLVSASLLEAALGPTISLERPRYVLTRADGSTLEVHRPAAIGANFRLNLIIPWP
jgi:hypothetical protein